MTEYGLWPMVVVGITSAAIMFGIFFATNRGPWKGIAVEEALARGGVVIDVRTPAEYAAGHVVGALNVPLQALPVDLDRGRPVIVYCATGARSARAAAILRAAGHDVVDAGTFRAFADHLRPI